MIEDLLPESAVRPLLEAHLAEMRSCVERGWGTWQQSVRAAPRLGTGRKTTRANAVYDFVTDELEAYFDMVGVPTSNKRGFLVASFGDGLVEVRFKKFRSRTRLTTSGIPTSQRLALERQQVSLDGVAVTCITLGYMPDELGIDLDVLAVSCTFGNHLLWSIDLRADDAAGGVVRPMKPSGSDDGPTVRSGRRDELEMELDSGAQ